MPSNLTILLFLIGEAENVKLVQNDLFKLYVIIIYIVSLVSKIIYSTNFVFFEYLNKVCWSKIGL